MAIILARTFEFFNQSMNKVVFRDKIWPMRRNLKRWGVATARLMVPIGSHGITGTSCMSQWLKVVHYNSGAKSAKRRRAAAPPLRLKKRIKVMWTNSSVRALPSECTDSTAASLPPRPLNTLETCGAANQHFTTIGRGH